LERAILRRNVVSRKDASIESLRGIAIVLVVAYHAISGPTFSVGAGAPYQFLSSIFDYVRMPLFTVISGYVYSLRPVRTALGEFYRGKARRLLVPLVTVSTLEYLARASLPGVTLVEPLAGIWRIYVYGFMHYWFIQAIFVCYLVIGWLDYRRYLENYRHWQIVFVLAIAVSIFVPRPLLFSLGAALYLMPFVVLGYGINRFATQLSHPAVLLGCGSLFAVTIVLQQLVNHGVVSLDNYSARALVAAVGASANVLFFRIRQPWRPLALLGGFAYFIYLTHAFSVGIGTRLASRLIDVAAHPGSHLLICLIVGLGLPIIAQLWLQRYHWFRLLFQGLRT